jgi:hypothetical protein
VLVSVPTLFALFPSFGEAPVGWRVFAIVGWSVVALVAVVAAQAKDDERDAQWAAMANALENLALDGILSVIPAHYKPAIYLPATAVGPLERFWPLEAAPEEFPMGVGAVGQCFGAAAERFYVGDDVHSGLTGLSPAQQHRYRDDVVVGAVPIWPGPVGGPVGVFSVIARHNDGRYCLESKQVNPSGLAELRDVAVRVARILSAGSQAEEQ